MNTVSQGSPIRSQRLKALRREGAALVALTTVLLAGTASGCRLGNNIVSAPDPDTISGYYSTSPKSLLFCSTTTTDDLQCADAPTSKVPALVASKMTNPMALLLQDLATREAVITSYPIGKNVLPVSVRDDLTTLRYGGSSSPITLWTDPDCTSRLGLNEDGKIVPGESVPVQGSTRSTSGRVALRITVVQMFDDGGTGACRASLQAMSDCYQSSSQCGGADAASNQALQANVQALFDPYVQAGVLTLSTIPDLSNLIYEVQYE